MIPSPVKKLLPWVILAGGLYDFSDSFAAAGTAIADVARTAGTNAEMGAIMTFLATDTMVSPLPDPATFPDYLRKSAAAIKTSDPGTDFWGTPYRLDRDGSAYAVRSAGPDRTYDTADDIVMRGRAARLDE